MGVPPKCGYPRPHCSEAILQANPTGPSRIGPKVIQCFVNGRARQVGITPQVRCGELMGREGSPRWCAITVALRVEVLVGIQHRTHPGCGNQVKLGFDPVEVITVVLSGRGLNCSPDDAQADQGETAGCQVSDVWPIPRALEVMIDEASFRE